MIPNPVRGNFQLINTVAGDKLRSGDVVSARIKEILPNGRFRLSFNARTITAKSHLTFHAGQLIRGRVVRNSKGLFLHLLDSKSGKYQNPSSQTATRTMLSAALLRAGLSLTQDGEALRRVALLKRTKGPQPRMARLYAELLSKGSDPTAGFLESVDTLFSGDRGNQRSRDWPEPPDADELKSELTGDSSEDPDESDTFIDLLNKVPGKTDYWMFKKLSGALGEGKIRMLWKIRRGMKPALALTIIDGPRTFEFLIEGLDQTKMAVFVDENTEINEKQWNKFRQSLALMNVEVDDTLLHIARSDGFTPGVDGAVHDLEGRA